MARALKNAPPIRGRFGSSDRATWRFRSLVALRPSWQFLLIILVGIHLTVACATDVGLTESGQRTNLLIGFLLPADEPQSLSLKQGVLLGVQKANEQPGPRVNVVVRGAVGQWGTDGVEAARMATDDEVDALLASSSGAATHLALQVAGRTGVPVISLCGDSSVTRTGVRWMARVTPSTIDEGRALLSFVATTPGKAPVRHWAALVPPARAGREIAADLSRAAQASANERPLILQVNGSSSDPWLTISPLLSNQVDAVFVWVSPATAGSTVKALRRAGFAGAIAGPSWLRCSDFLSAAGLAGEQCITAVPAFRSEDLPRFEHFSRDYRSRFGTAPDLMAALSYDAATLLVQLLRKIGDRPAHTAFPITSIGSGVTGPLAFDAEGNRKLELHVTRIGSDPSAWPYATAAESSGKSGLQAVAGELRETAANP